MSALKPLSENDFQPRGGTPLYDAIGTAIAGLDKKLTDFKSTKGMLVVVTDGYENSSRRETLSSIKELIEGRQAQGWLITFLAAGLDAAKQGTELGVRHGNVASMAFSRAGLDATMDVLACQTSQFAHFGMKAVPQFTDEERAAMNGEAGKKS